MESTAFRWAGKWKIIIFNMDVLSDATRAVWVEQKLYGYRQRKGSIMNDGDPDLYLAYRDALLYLRNQIRKTSLKELYPLFDSYFLRNMARKKSRRCTGECLIWLQN